MFLPIFILTTIATHVELLDHINLSCFKNALPNQELSVLYGGPPLSIMGDNYPCMFPICCA